MVKKLIIFLIRRKLGLKKYQHFKFIGQKYRDDYYYFTEDEIIKVDWRWNLNRSSSVSLNWLLNDECNIERL